jgi:twitching motility two-component system response regulator PilG
MSKRKRVLIADDSSAMLDELSGAFEDAGYEVGTAADGEEAFRKLSALEPEALLLDVYMPKLDGAHVCRVVKAHPHWRRTYLVIMSARISDREVEEYRRLGADAVLRKPFQAKVALDAIEGAIGPPVATP